ncbi:GNAT family N-acetyltransferase [Bacteroides reticulotermitis]|uniref:N-acetyltransferase domain-containing protein n=2 Tax=Bacteroides reticulotermitis TaxID=1133319 RepID=W4USY5_9BACE|nr:N-acetyltransferase [Bacteroides reticulotermitis]MBB4043668.1 putative acetyltransferase [Bacteroides reticulotermitis]GAE83743.1 hypothetical protein JCM10512_2037 [Bacteroides reticulotermitis JCM 10512]
MTKYTIRQETQQDHAEVYQLIKTAFETAKVKDGDEQDFAVKLREGKNFIPELSLVAEDNGKLIGHIMLTKTPVAQSNGERYEALLVAPLSVLLAYRDQGVGASLMKEALRLAADLNYEAAFLTGDPTYYQRFGFQSASKFGITCPGIPDQFTLAYEIIPHALNSIQGTIGEW